MRQAVNKKPQVQQKAWMYSEIQDIDTSPKLSQLAPAANPTIELKVIPLERVFTIVKFYYHCSVFWQWILLREPVTKVEY